MKILLVYLEEDAKLKRCLNSLKKYSPEIEVVKHKADSTKTNVAEEIYNELIPKIDDDVMIWHPDMEATEGWYEKLKNYYSVFDVIGVKLVYPNGLINHYGGWLRHDGCGIHPHQYCMDFCLEKPMECVYVTGPGTLIKKRVFNKVGKWDNQFDYFIDVDYCFRAREKGFKVGVVPVKLIHHERGDNSKRWNQKENIKRLTNSWKKFITKHQNILAKYK